VAVILDAAFNCIVASTVAEVVNMEIVAEGRRNPAIYNNLLQQTV